jgi:hypothetical protein
MTEVFSILPDLSATGRALETFARHIKDWSLLSARLYDIREGLGATELSLEAWHRKYNIQPKRHAVYLQVLFGRQGFSHIQNTLESAIVIFESIQNDINNIVAQVLKARPKNLSTYLFHPNDDELKVCLQWIRKSPSRSRRFIYSTFITTNDLEMHLEQLHRKLTLLERLSDYYLSQEHSDVFSKVNRLPGRRNIHSQDASHHPTIQHTLLDRLAARKDAELLHRACQNTSIHIGLSVPQIHKRDFAFLLSQDEDIQEVLLHPVKITAVNDATRVPSTITTALSSLVEKTQQEKCYVLPSPSSSAGFQLSVPPSSILAALEYKSPLLTLIRDEHPPPTTQPFYPHDQSTLASGLAHDTFRLIGSPWLQFLDCQNVRCRKNANGQWTTMLAAVPGPPSVTHALDEWYATHVHISDAMKRMHVFRIGLVLAELALHCSIGTLVFNPASSTIDIMVPNANGEDEVVDVEEVAAEVERRTNVFLANMVVFCLAVVRDDDVGSEGGGLEGAYYEEVLGQAAELERLAREWRRGGSPAGSAIGSVMGSPRSARSVRSGRSARSANVYVH